MIKFNFQWQLSEHVSQPEDGSPPVTTYFVTEERRDCEPRLIATFPENMKYAAQIVSLAPLLMVDFIKANYLEGEDYVS